MTQLPATSFEFLDRLSAWIRDKPIKQEEAENALRSMSRNQKQKSFSSVLYYGTMPRDNFDSY